MIKKYYITYLIKKEKYIDYKKLPSEYMNNSKY